MKEYALQLTDLATGKALALSGRYVVTNDGAVDVLQVYDTDDTALISATARSVAFTSGNVKFRTIDTVDKVDIYGYTSDGYAFQLRGIQPGQVTQIFIDRNRLQQHFVYPFTLGDARDLSASAENKVDIFLPAGVRVSPRGVGVLVTDTESAKTIDVGTDGTASGVDDADGFIDGIVLTTAGFVAAEVGYGVGSNSVYVDITGATAEWTLGALFHPTGVKAAIAEGTDHATSKNGFAPTKEFIPTNDGTNIEELSITFGGTPTSIGGFIILPWTVNNVPA